MNRTSDASQEREKLMLERIAWLEQRIAGLAENWKRVPYLASTAVLGIPAAFVWGIGWGIVGVGLGLSLGGVSAYLLSIRRSTCQEEIRTLQRELSRMRKS